MNQNNFEKAKIHFARGLNFFNNFEYDLSEKEFLFCLELVPDRLSAVSNLINRILEEKKYSKILHNLCETMKLYIENIRSYKLLFY